MNQTTTSHRFSPHFRPPSADRCAQRNSLCSTRWQLRRNNISMPVITAGAGRLSKLSGQTAAAWLPPGAARRDRVTLRLSSVHDSSTQVFGGKKMRSFWTGPMLLAVLAIFCGAVTLSSKGETLAVRGDYVEVRTASVFAG